MEELIILTEKALDLGNLIMIVESDIIYKKNKKIWQEKKIADN